MSFFKQGIIATLMLMFFSSFAQAEEIMKKLPQEAIMFQPQCEIIISQSVITSNARQAEDMMNGKVHIEIFTGADRALYNVERQMHYTVTAPLHWETGTISRYDELGNMVYISEFSNEEETCETGKISAEMQWISKRKTSLIVKTNPSHFFYSAQEITVYFEDGTTSQEVVHDDAKGIFRFQRIDWDLNNFPVAVLIHNEYGDIDLYELKLDINTFATSPKTIVLGTESKVYDFTSDFFIEGQFLKYEKKSIIGTIEGCKIFSVTGLDIILTYKGKDVDNDLLPDNGELIEICENGLIKMDVQGYDGDFGQFVFSVDANIKDQLDGLLGDLVPPSNPILSLPIE